MALATVAALGTVTVATAATGMLMNDAALRPTDDTTATTAVSPETSTSTSPAPQTSVSTASVLDRLPVETDTTAGPADATVPIDTTLPIDTTPPIETTDSDTTDSDTTGRTSTTARGGSDAGPSSTEPECIHGLDVAEIAGRPGATVPDGPPGSIVSEVAKVACGDDDSGDED